jgi:uncharacterized membrane protein YccC
MISAPTRLALKVGLATSLATFLAFLFHLQDAYWVGISAFLICTERVGNSLDKMLQRIGCTVLGAAIAVIVVREFLEKPVALVLVSFCLMTFIVYRGFKSNSWYIWIFTAITFFMVVATVFTGAHPQAILDVAFYRSLDIVVGSVVGFLVNALVFPVHAGRLLDEALPEFLDHFELYYTQWMDSLFDQKVKVNVGDLPADLAKIKAMQSAAAKECIFFERQRLHLLEQVERIEIAVKESLALSPHFTQADLAYVRVYQAEIFALRDVFKLFLRNPLEHQEALVQALDKLHERYDELRREGLNFNYSPASVTVFHELVGLHQLLFSLIRPVPSLKLKAYRSPSLPWLESLKRDRFYWLFGMKVGFAVLLCPLVWIGWNLPGAMQIAVSMGAVLNLDFAATKQKSLMRVYGCLVGAALAMITLIILRVESLLVLLVLIFAAAYYFSYLHNSSSRFSYLGTQAIVAYLMGVIVGFSPSLIPDPSVERLVDITAAVLLLYFILEYLWPFSQQELQAHYQGQLDAHFAELTTMAVTYLQKPDFDLIAAIAHPLEMIRRDAGQAVKCQLPEPYYVKRLDQLEAFLVFIASSGQALQAYTVWVHDLMLATSQGASAALLASLDRQLHKMRENTLKGGLVPLNQVMALGTLMRMAHLLHADM